MMVSLIRTTGGATAMPTSPTDESQVPHYFGPYPNWANSPFTLPNATVTLNGDGHGATAVAEVDPVTQGIASIEVTSPGSGYSPGTTTVTIESANPGAGGATATAHVSTSGSVTFVQVDNAGGGYTSPEVSFSGGGGTGTMVHVGNPLADRAYATDYVSVPPVNVFVVAPAPSPNGTLLTFQTLNQAAAGSSPTPSAGQTFNAYVLRPTGTPNEYQVILDSGTLTVPALADPAVSEIATYDVTDTTIQAGDVLAFYGAGIPVDIVETGADLFSYPAGAPPIQGTTLTVGGAQFPLYGQARTYSFGAEVIDASLATPLENAEAMAYGGVDAVVVSDGGWGYSMPTVEFDLPDAPDGVTAKAHVASIALGDSFDGMDANGMILPNGIIVDEPGSGYRHAPNVAIHNGTLFDPISGATPASALTTLKVTSVAMDEYGSGYVSAPMVTFSDASGSGSGAAGTALVDVGAVTSIEVTEPGSGYLTVGMRKFVDGLPGLCAPPDCPTSGKYIPLGVAEPKVYGGIEADEYVIGLVQYRTQFHSDLPPTLVRGYVQLETADNADISQHFPLVNELLDGTSEPVLRGDGTQWLAVTPPQYLGPVIAATKNKPVRIVFHNLLPTGAKGDLFLPTDSSLMGSGMGPMDMGEPMVDGTVLDEARNPMCSEYPKPEHCFADNRATLHLHGGITPWISDGTAHQWITPAGEETHWPQGVSVANVPDMGQAGCDGDRDGCQTFYYTNQQSARLLFYHDHSWGITRLNVYAGEAAGYLITDDTEKALLASGTIPGAGDTIPLIIQDKTFVPDAEQLAWQDPAWDTARWGTKGSFWYHHVYMPAQNPGDPGGLSAYGRWMYGPWFWPPAADTIYGPIANPYYDPNCNLDDPATWQYQTDPFCEPAEIPGTPNISVGMEQFNDTPVVNGVAYPTLTLEPKTYRFRILSAANDRFFNFQWYIADPTQGNGLTEVALNPAELEAAQSDLTVFPTPIENAATSGPDWIQIGTEGGFLPAPVVVDGQQETTWITDPTRFDVGNVDKHSLLLAPAERADVLVDFSRFAGKTLILYNDAPAAFPARVPSYDYYTGAPDLTPVGAPAILPGYGPNTRTIMQVTIAPSAPAPAFNLARLQAAFRHNANGTGVFEAGQHPIIVGQAAYNSAYGTNFAASSNCNAPGNTLQRCDGLVRVNDTTWFSFNTLRNPTSSKLTLHVEPKAIHDETNATTFDEYGRMQANLGIEAQPPTPGNQNVTLYPFVNPATEIIDGTNLPKQNVAYDANGLPVSDVRITPIANNADGTQIWRVTHNGVDTHPIHFHLYDVQVVNRVTWDNIIIAPDATELGWKDTVRIAPLEDTIVALRPIIPEVPWELPNAIRPLNPMMPLGSTAMFNNVGPDGEPTAQIVNALVNFGWEYVYHCHILSHEEMDMMRPVSLALPPVAPDGLTLAQASDGSLGISVTWNDNSIAETAYVLQRQVAGSGNWQDVTTIASPLDQPNVTGPLFYTDTGLQQGVTYVYRVVAQNTVGYGGAFPAITAQSVSAEASIMTSVLPEAPSNLAGTIAFGPVIDLTWVDNAATETGFVLARSDNGGAFAAFPTLAADTTSFADTTAQPGHTYTYQIYAENLAGSSSLSNQVTIAVPASPAAPSSLALAVQIALPPTGPRVRVLFRDNQNDVASEIGFQVYRSVNGGAFTLLTTLPARAGVGNVPAYFDYAVVGGSSYSYYAVAINASSASLPSNTASVTLLPAPAAPSNFRVTSTAITGGGTTARLNLAWSDNSTNEARFILQRATDAGFTQNLFTANPGLNITTYINTNLPRGVTFYYRIRAENGYGVSAWVNLTPFPITTP
jgi:FtsP/CotA-like multicopper oxidase with cupredoxin domain